MKTGTSQRENLTSKIDGKKTSETLTGNRGGNSKNITGKNPPSPVGTEEKNRKRSLLLAPRGTMSLMGKTS